MAACRFHGKNRFTLKVNVVAYQHISRRSMFSISCLPHTFSQLHTSWWVVCEHVQISWCFPCKWLSAAATQQKRYLFATNVMLATISSLHQLLANWLWNQPTNGYHGHSPISVPAWKELLTITFTAAASKFQIPSTSQAMCNQMVTIWCPDLCKWDLNKALTSSISYWVI